MNRLIEQSGVLYKKCRHIVLYCVIGISGACLDMCAFWLLTDKAGMKFIIVSWDVAGVQVPFDAIILANICSVTLGITNNFILNVRYNFKVQDNLLKRFIQFYLIGIVGLCMSIVLLFVFVTQLRFDAMLIKFLSIFVITIMQFTLNKLITFKKRLCNQ